MAEYIVSRTMTFFRAIAGKSEIEISIPSSFHRRNYKETNALINETYKPAPKQMSYLDVREIDSSSKKYAVNKRGKINEGRIKED